MRLSFFTGFLFAWAVTQNVHAGDDSWSGYFAGVNTGYAIGNSKIHTHTPLTATGADAIAGTYFANQQNASNVSASGTAAMSDSALIAGVTLGYNTLLSNGHLLGILADYNTLNLSDSKVKQTSYPGFSGFEPSTKLTAKIDNTISLRARYGVLVDDFLVYLTGGVTLARMKFNMNFTDGAASASSHESAYKFGWIVGAGSEYKVNKNWSVKAEYLHYDFGNIVHTSTNMTNGVTNFTNQPFQTEMDAKLDMISIGVNKYF
jgi:outer membrane immunogenic protein